MPAVGTAALIVALATALYSSAAALVGVRTGRPALVVSARRAIVCVAALCTLCVVLLEVAYARSDFSFALVANNSSTDTPIFYRLTAMWSSQPGSLLLWAFLLSIYSSLALHATRKTLREILPYAIAVLGGVTAFFLGLMVFFATPFAHLASVPAEGAGLSPLLRHPAMMIHPPMLYSGYVGFAIPFAFAVGALVTRRTGAEWIRATRRYTLLAWALLGTGIMLGALWSFSELGWGGYWAWDPVENASLMPWLIGTAFLHSGMVQERRGMLKIWNVSLVMGSFILALVGTFLVRSGILESIHAFGASTLGIPFVGFIALVTVGSVALVVSRRASLRSEHKLDSLLSREAIFLLNNLALVGLCFVIFWGTFFPLISEAVTGTKASVGPPWFNRYTVPLALVLVLLTGVGPMLAWRRTTPARLARVLRGPLIATAVAVALLLSATPAAASPPSLILFACVAFVLAVVTRELARGTRERRRATGEAWPVAARRLVANNRRRYGGYLAHAGIALLFLGIAASSAFMVQRDVRLRPGQTATVGGTTVTYREATVRAFNDPSGTGAALSFGAVLDVQRGGRHLVLRPAHNVYPSRDPAAGPFARLFEGESTSEVALKWGLRGDLWTAIQPDLSILQKPVAMADARFGNADPQVKGTILRAIGQMYLARAPAATFRVIVFPWVAWIWLGGALVLLGAITALRRPRGPRMQTQRATAPQASRPELARQPA
jgi:cytochrome c-type biogenesis protein CcmF